MYDFSNFYSLWNSGVYEKEVSRWKFVITVEKIFIPRLPFHFCSHILCLDRHNLVCIASQMQIPWQSSAVTAYCSSSCLYGASSRGCLTEVWRLFPCVIYHLFNIKSFLPTACVYRIPAFAVCSLPFQIHVCVLLKVPPILGSCSSEYVKIPH